MQVPICLIYLTIVTIKLLLGFILVTDNNHSHIYCRLPLLHAVKRPLAELLFCSISILLHSLYQKHNNWIQPSPRTVIFITGSGTVLESLGAVIPSSATVIRIVRMFKIFKTFKLARNMRGLQAVLQTMILSLPALFNVFLLLSLGMYIYHISNYVLLYHYV